MNKVLNFHDISDSIWFEKLLLMLKSKYTMVSIRDIENYFYGSATLKNTCHITFDDGDKTFYNIVYPILKKHNIPASIFISPKMCSEGGNFWFQEVSGYDATKLKDIISDSFNLGKSILEKHTVFSILKCFTIDQIWHIIRKYQSRFNIAPRDAFNITIDQILEIEKDGLVAVGAHTIHHPILANENDELSEWEIAESLIGLENILGYKVKYFAFPNGWSKYDFGIREVNILQRNNCKIAFACTPGNYSNKDNPLAIKRYNLSYANLAFIWIKLSLGEYWELIKKLFLGGEIAARKEIYQALGSVSKQL